LIRQSRIKVVCPNAVRLRKTVSKTRPMTAFQCFQLCGKALAWRDNSDVRWRKVPFHSDNFKFLSRTALGQATLATWFLTRTDSEDPPRCTGWSEAVAGAGTSDGTWIGPSCRRQAAYLHGLSVGERAVSTVLVVFCVMPVSRQSRDAVGVPYPFSGSWLSTAGDGS
jgi:hypothetical protein